METIRILDNYRLAIADDKLATLLLAWLVQAGARTEHDLVSDLKLSPSEAKKKIDQLYHASCIELAPSQGWRTTFFGREVLTSLGITTGVAEYLLSQFDIPKDDSALLSTYSTYFYGSTRNDYKVVVRLKCARDIAKANESYFSKTKSLARFLYAIIVGQSPASYLIDTKALCTSLRNQQTQQEGDSTFHYPVDAIKWGLAKRLCDQARADIQRSNSYILYGQKGSGKTSVFTKLLTETRVLSALTAGEFDDPLSFLHPSNDKTDILSNVFSDAKFLVCYRNAMTREGILEGDVQAKDFLEDAKRRWRLILISPTRNAFSQDYCRKLLHRTQISGDSQNSTELDIAIEQLRTKLDRLQVSSTEHDVADKLDRLIKHLSNVLSQLAKKSGNVRM